MALLESLDLQKLIREGAEVVSKSPYVIRTPIIKVDPKRFGIEEDIELYLKMEGMQNQGSFKIRGVVNMMENAPKEVLKREKRLITMSAGNFGRSFAYMCQELKLSGKVVMPVTAPSNRAEVIRSFGVEVEKVPTSELQQTVDKHVEEQGMLCLHPFDDPYMIAGNGSMGVEIMEDLAAVDVVLVCCGGGGLLAGTAAAIKLSGRGGENTRVIGVEPEGAPTMHLSLRGGKAVTKGDVKSVASGLAPPYAGKLAYSIVKKYVEEVVLVSDDEIKQSVWLLYRNGLVVEPSGAASFTALRCGRAAGVAGKKVVVSLTGSNVSPEELIQLK